MLLAKNSGCKSILVLTGLGETSLSQYKYLWADYEPDFIAENVLTAVQKISALNS